MGHIDSKFGTSIHQIPYILRIVENTKIHISGIRIRTGSDTLDINVFSYAAEILFEVAKNFKNLQFIDFGNGFKVPYREGDVQTNMKELGERLSARFLALCQKYGRDLALTFEPDKFLVDQAGYFLMKVNAVRQTASTVFAGIDSGFSHLIRPMFYGATHFIENIFNPEGRKRFYSVVGCVCETDTFASNRQIAKVTEGNILCFHDAGAYCYTISSNYNSHLRPVEVLWYKEEARLIHRAETPDDLVGGQVEIEI